MADVSYLDGDQRRVAVECQCGERRTVLWGNLRKGSTTNCGCQRKAWNRSHGESRTILYHRWAGMNDRCSNPNSPIFKHYGGRGIAVCPEWRHDYSAFAAWARAGGWSESLEIDRIDNDGPYSPQNCRLTDHTTNMRNTRVAKNVTAWGESQSVGAWADDPRCVVDYRCLLDRLYRGWEPHDALTRPKRRTSMTR